MPVQPTGLKLHIESRVKTYLLVTNHIWHLEVNKGTYRRTADKDAFNEFEAKYLPDI